MSDEDVLGSGVKSAIVLVVVAAIISLGFVFYNLIPENAEPVALNAQQESYYADQKTSSVQDKPAVTQPTPTEVSLNQQQKDFYASQEAAKAKATQAESEHVKGATEAVGEQSSDASPAIFWIVLFAVVAIIVGVGVSRFQNEESLEDTPEQPVVKPSVAYPTPTTSIRRGAWGKSLLLSRLSEQPIGVLREISPLPVRLTKSSKPSSFSEALREDYDLGAFIDNYAEEDDDWGMDELEHKPTRSSSFRRKNS